METGVYLTFNGNCKEAMCFYQRCFGGDLSLHTIGDSPLAGRFPTQMKSLIIHASLRKNSLLLMGTDLVDEVGLVSGNAVSIFLSCDSEREVRDYLRKLSAGNPIDFPAEKTYSEATLSSVTDKYGNHWLLHYPTHHNRGL